MITRYYDDKKHTYYIVVNGERYYEHHTALCRGYQSVKYERLAKYNGRFGKGYVVYTHNPKSTQYCYITYCVKEV